jgi:HlyD family secretion protein
LGKRILIIIFFLLLIGVSVFVYLGQHNAQLRELYYSGTIEAVHAELSFLVNGRTIDVPVDEGQSVKKGQLLVVLDQSEYEALYEQAIANMEKSIKNFEKAEKVLMLYKKTLPDDVARAEAGIKVLRSQLRELEAGYREQDVEQARLAVSNAKDIMEEAEKDKIRYEKLFQRGVDSEAGSHLHGSHQ